MRGFDHATILIPVSNVSSRNAWHNDPRFACVADTLNLLYRRVRSQLQLMQATPDLCPKYDEKARGGRGILAENLGVDVRQAS